MDNAWEMMIMCMVRQRIKYRKSFPRLKDYGEHDWNPGGHTALNYCTSTKFQYPFNFTIFTDPEDALILICVKYHEIGINLYAWVGVA